MRTWRTHYRGPVIVTSSATGPRDLPRGVVMCLVELVECREAVDDDHTSTGGFVPPPGSYVWELADVAPLPPLRVRGRLGLWRPDVDLLAGIVARMASSASGPTYSKT